MTQSVPVPENLAQSINVPARIQPLWESRDGYGEHLGYNLPTLSSLMADNAFNTSPDPDTMGELFNELDQHLGVADNLMICGTGFSLRTIMDMARSDHDGDVCQMIADSIESDDECPFIATADALTYYNDGTLKEKAAANQVFDYLFNTTAEDLLKSVVTAATKAYDRKQQPGPGVS